MLNGSPKRVAAMASFRALATSNVPINKLPAAMRILTMAPKKTGVARFELDGLSAYGILRPRYRRELVGLGGRTADGVTRVAGCPLGNVVAVCRFFEPLIITSIGFHPDVLERKVGLYGLYECELFT